MANITHDLLGTEPASFVPAAMIAAAKASPSHQSRRASTSNARATTARALEEEAAAVAEWLHCIAVNCAHTHYSFFLRHQRPAAFSPGHGFDDATSTLVNFTTADAQSQSSDTATGKFLALVAAALEKLDPRYRRISPSRGSRGISYDEIAQALGLNAGTVKIRVARARCNLREFLAPAGPDLGRAAPLRAGFGADRSSAGLPPPEISRRFQASAPCLVPTIQPYPHPSFDQPTAGRR